MIAFRFSGIDGAIEQTIDELWGYPDETSGELYEFYVQLLSVSFRNNVARRATF
jgi:hypothetical protein